MAGSLLVVLFVEVLKLLGGGALLQEVCHENGLSRWVGLPSFLIVLSPAYV